MITQIKSLIAAVAVCRKPCSAPSQRFRQLHHPPIGKTPPALAPHNVHHSHTRHRIHRLKRKYAHAVRHGNMARANQLHRKARHIRHARRATHHDMHNDANK